MTTTTTKDFRQGIRKATDGNEAIHVHECREGDHAWTCNSSYCGSRLRNCPDHSGAPPKHDEGES